MADTSSAATPSTNGFKDPRGLARLIRILIYIQIVIAFLNAISSIMQYNLLLDFQAGKYTDQTEIKAVADANDLREQILGIVWIGFYILTGIVILKWIYRSSYNVRQLGAKGLRATPGWAVGYYFIPFVNLVMPFLVMKEVWKASSNPGAWETQKSSYLIGAWWTLLIIGNVLGRLSFRVATHAKTIGELLNASALEAFAVIAIIPLDLVFLSLMGKVVAMQVASHNAQSGGAAREGINADVQYRS